MWGEGKALVPLVHRSLTGSQYLLGQENDAVDGSGQFEDGATCNRASCIDQDCPDAAADGRGYQTDPMQEVHTVNQSNSINQDDVCPTQGQKNPALERELKRKLEDSGEMLLKLFKRARL